MQSDPHGPRAEAFRALRTNLQFIDAATHPRSMTFTSSLPGEGKTTTTANLAISMAAAGSRVCVVEGDLRRPRMLQYMGMEGSVGLTNVLIGQADLADVLQPFGNANIQVLGAGQIPPNPSELLGSEAMSRTVRELEDMFDYVIIDAPPLLPVTDAAVLSTITGGVVVVVGCDIVHKEQLTRAPRVAAGRQRQRARPRRQPDPHQGRRRRVVLLPRGLRAAVAPTAPARSARSDRRSETAGV